MPFSPAAMQEVEAYASHPSVAAGSSIGFHVSVRTASSQGVTLEVFRSSQLDFGDSQFGLQADSLYLSDYRPLISVPDDEEPEFRASFPARAHPTPENAAQNGCRWPLAMSWDVPEDTASSVYVARLTYREAVTYAMFVVRPAVPGAHSRILCQISVTTHQAYNPWGGACFYGPPISPSGVETVSFDRPCQLWDYILYDQPIVTWLEENYPVEFCTGVDLHHDEELLAGQQLFVSCGHDEYWSGTMRDRIDAFAAEGGNVMFLSGNTCFRPVDFPDPAGRRMDMVGSSWDNVGRPTAHTTGVNLTAGRWSSALPSVGFTVVERDHWVFAGTGLEAGAKLGEDAGVIGYECDGTFRTSDGGIREPTPPNFVTVATADLPEWADLPGVATMGLFRRGHGTVMTASTTGWGQGLRGPSPDVDRVTRNLVDRLRTRFGVLYVVAPDGTLLWYRDHAGDGSGDVTDGQVVGRSGWDAYSVVFGGGDGIIYAVNEDGDLLWHRDTHRDGTGDVGDGQVIGSGGWGSFGALCAASDGSIYATTHDGDLAVAHDETRDGTGDAGSPLVIGLGGWDRFSVVFAGGDGVVYGLTPDGELVWHHDNDADEGGGRVIGKGWDGVRRACSGGDGTIYATTATGDLLWSRDDVRDGTGDVVPMAVVGQGGWDGARWLVSGA